MVNTSSWFKSNLSRLVFYTLCFGLCLYQNYKIFYLYFSYSTVNSISYGNYTEISVPALTVCIDKKHVLRPEYRYNWSKATNVSDFLQSPYFYTIVNKLTISHQFEIFYSAEQLFDNQCKVVRTYAYEEINQTFISCQSLSRTYQSMDYYKMCFTFLSQVDRQPDHHFTALNRAVFMDYTVEIIHVNLTMDIPEVSAFLHSRKEKIKNFYKKKLIIFNRSSDFTYLKYHRTATKLLQDPYQSKCYDYGKQGHYSRYDCIAKCRVRNLEQAFPGKTPGNFLVYDNSSELFFFETFQELFKRPDLDLSIGQICMDECGTRSECQTEHYITDKVVTDYKWPLFSVLVFSPDVPDLIYSQSPKLFFEEFVSYVGSLIGFWFGFSVIMLFNGFDFCLSFCRLYFKEREFIKKCRSLSFSNKMDGIFKREIILN